MAFDNTVTVIGNVTRDPELRFTPGGMAVASFGVAWNRRKQDGEEEVSFFDITCFRDLAENVCLGGRVFRPQGFDLELRRLVELLILEPGVELRLGFAGSGLRPTGAARQVVGRRGKRGEQQHAGDGVKNPKLHEDSLTGLKSHRWHRASSFPSPCLGTHFSLGGMSPTAGF